MKRNLVRTVMAATLAVAGVLARGAVAQEESPWGAIDGGATVETPLVLYDGESPAVWDDLRDVIDSPPEDQWAWWSFSGDSLEERDPLGWDGELLDHFKDEDLPLLPSDELGGDVVIYTFGGAGGGPDQGVVPEPASMLLAGVAAAMLVFATKRRRTLEA